MVIRQEGTAVMSGISALTEEHPEMSENVISQ